MLGPRIDYGPPTTQQSTILNVIHYLMVLSLFLVIGGLRMWRLHHFPHTVATIETVWEKQVHRRGETVVTMAELSFTRTSPAGEVIPCRYSFEIGRPDDGFKVGDKLEIVPATGTCQRADIIGRSKIVS